MAATNNKTKDVRNMTAKTKLTEYVYSLINISNGNILTAKLNRRHYTSEKDLARTRNWKLSQFYLDDNSLIDAFICDSKIKNFPYQSMGTAQIWVKEKDIDGLYTAIALSVLWSFPQGKDIALFGAFLFHYNSELFMDKEFSSLIQIKAILLELKLGKACLEFLDSFGLLKYRRALNDDISFSMAELELIKREKSKINTTFTNND